MKFPTSHFFMSLFIITTLTMLIGFSQQATAISNPLETPQFGEQDVTLVEGEVRTLGPFNATRVAVGDGGLVQVQLLDSGEVLLIGKSTGATSLRIWLNNNKHISYRVNITDKAQAQDITLRKIVSTRVRIIEFRESSLKKIGIDWSKTAAGPRFFMARDLISTVSGDILDGLSPTALNPVGNTSSMPLFLGSNTALESTISFMQSAGHASTLAEPTLSCLSGESAHFLAGGEVPFAVIGKDGTPAISFKDYGIKLEIKPLADRHGRISTAIETEVSSIDSSVSVNGAPGFITRKTSTHMNVMSGQTIVISGLLTKSSSKDIDYIPGLANLPIIGKSFQTQNMSETQTHLVVFLTPTIIDPSTLSQLTTTATEQQSSSLKQGELQVILETGLADIAVEFGG